MTPIEQQERDQIDSHIDFLLESLDNKVSVISKLLGKLYNQKENTLRVYLSRRSSLYGSRRKFYLAILDDFCEKYNSVEKVKQIYYKTIFGVEDDCRPVVEVLKERKDVRYFRPAIERIKKKYPEKILTSTKNPSNNKKFICKDAVEDANFVLDEIKHIWNDVVTLRDELVKHFKSKADFCWYLADMSDLAQNSIYVTLFYRINKKNFDYKKVEVGFKYLELLQKAKDSLK